MTHAEGLARSLLSHWESPTQSCQTPYFHNSAEWSIISYQVLFWWNIMVTKWTQGCSSFCWWHSQLSWLCVYSNKLSLYNHPWAPSRNMSFHCMNDIEHFDIKLSCTLSSASGGHYVIQRNTHLALCVSICCRCWSDWGTDCLFQDCVHLLQT